MLRFILVLIMLALPTFAHADDSATTDPNAVQSANGSAVSPQTSGVLQPAAMGSGSSLQSADATGGGAAQSTGQNIQQSGSADDAKLLIQGEADTPKTMDAGPNLTWLWYILLVLVIASGATAAAVLIQRRRIRPTSK